MNLDFFILGMALLFIHELDAIRCKEWLIFPGLSLLDDKAGFITFTFAHIPLLYWIFQEIKMENELFIYYFDLFFIIHLVLHLLFLKHPKNEFTDWVSWTIIVGAAACGVLDLIVK